MHFILESQCCSRASLMQAEAAAAAGESSFRAFMVAVQRSTTNVAMVQQVLMNFCLILAL